MNNFRFNTFGSSYGSTLHSLKELVSKYYNETLKMPFSLKYSKKISNIVSVIFKCALAVIFIKVIRVFSEIVLKSKNDALEKNISDLEKEIILSEKGYIEIMKLINYEKQRYDQSIKYNELNIPPSLLDQDIKDIEQEIADLQNEIAKSMDTSKSLSKSSLKSVDNDVISTRLKIKSSTRLKIKSKELEEKNKNLLKLTNKLNELNNENKITKNLIVLLKQCHDMDLDVEKNTSFIKRLNVSIEKLNTENMNLSKSLESTKECLKNAFDYFLDEEKKLKKRKQKINTFFLSETSHAFKNLEILRKRLSKAEEELDIKKNELEFIADSTLTGKNLIKDLFDDLKEIYSETDLTKNLLEEKMCIYETFMEKIENELGIVYLGFNDIKEKLEKERKELKTFDKKVYEDLEISQLELANAEKKLKEEVDKLKLLHETKEKSDIAHMRFFDAKRDLEENEDKEAAQLEFNNAKRELEIKDEKLESPNKTKSDLESAYDQIENARRDVGMKKYWLTSATRSIDRERRYISKQFNNTRKEVQRRSVIIKEFKREMREKMQFELRNIVHTKNDLEEKINRLREVNKKLLSEDKDLEKQMKITREKNIEINRIKESIIEIMDGLQHLDD